MTTLFKKVALSVAAICLAVSLDVQPSAAQPGDSDFAQESIPTEQQIPQDLSSSEQTASEQAAKTTKTKKRRKKTKKSSKKAKKGRQARGKMQDGMTVEQIVAFQLAHGLKADGIIGPETRTALEAEKASQQVIGTQSKPYIPEIPLDPNPEVNQDETPTLNGGSKIVFSRYGHLDVTESGEGSEKRYALAINGQPLLTVEGQPSIIGISRAYDMGMQDAIVLTAYNLRNAALCPYRNYILVLGEKGRRMFEIGNCTREYQAQVNNGSLYVTFFDREDNRAVGAIWRLEGETLTQL
jgi:hypothetical protein